MTDERSFDVFLEDTLGELPPDLDQTRAVTPWRKAMSRVVWGIGLTTLTLNFSNLNYILPTIGVVLSLLGYRALRLENQWFRACWFISIYTAAAKFIDLVLNATIIRLGEGNWLIWAGLLLNFAQMFCLWKGIRAVRRKAGQPDQAGAVAALMVWYVVLTGLALVNAGGWLIALPLLVSYFFILRSLSKIPALLDEAGYEIGPTSVKLSDRTVMWSYFLSLAVCIVLAGLLFCRYPMQWDLADPAEHTGLEQVKDHLLDLGMPQQVLDDLSAEDLALMEGAVHVEVDEYEAPFNDGRKEATTNGNHTTIRTVYDVKELLLTDVAVGLADGRWMAVHHFYWQVDPRLRTTECMLFWPAYQHPEGYRLVRGLEGRLLYDWEGERFTGDYYKISDETYTTQSLLGMGGGLNTWPIATFSLPRKGENCRGYVSYVVEVVNEGWIFDSWNNYTHQITPVVYPLMTAEEYEKSGIWGGFGGFDTSQTAVQFFPHRLGEEQD